MPGKLHNGITNTYVSRGYMTKGFKKSVVDTLTSLRGLAEDETKEEALYWVLKDLPQSFPVPDAWRVMEEEDCRGLVWKIFDCVEVDITNLKPTQLGKYAWLWFCLDACDERVDIRLSCVDKLLNKTEVDLVQMYYAYHGFGSL